MKRVVWLVPIAVLIGLFLALQSARSGSSEFVVQETPERTIDTTPAEQPQSNAITTDLAMPAPPDTARVAEVMGLADGDSFDILWSDSGEFDEVRLFGINAPEGDACFGSSARQVLLEIINEQPLFVDTIERDEFGRILADVWAADLFVNAALVESGAALALSDGGRHADLITEAQEHAQASLAGLWAPDQCGTETTAIRIAWIEANAPGPDNENKNGEWITIVNDDLSPVDLSGWGIRDESTRHRYFFPDGFVLAGGDGVQVFSGCGQDNARELYWCDEDPVWNNGGDTGFLVDADGKFVDSRSYGG